MRGPASVAATVCSQCAARDPSVVTTVHSSSSTRSCRCPVSASARSPAPIRRPAAARGPGAPSLGRNGSMCICRPMPCPPYPSTMPNRAAVTLLGGVGADFDRVGYVGEPVARHHRRDAGFHGFPGCARQPSSAGINAPTPKVIAESPCQPSRIAPQSMDTRSPDASISAADGMPCTTRSLTDEQMLAGNP